MTWMKTGDYLLGELITLLNAECRFEIFPEGEVSEALARAAACQDDPYERMLLGKRPEFAVTSHGC